MGYSKLLIVVERRIPGVRLGSVVLVSTLSSPLLGRSCASALQLHRSTLFSPNWADPARWVGLLRN